MLEKSLLPVSIELLYDGMVVPYGIYDYTATHLIINQGNILNASQIETIKRLNGGKDIIYVTDSTYSMLMDYNLLRKIRVQNDFEKNTGYTEAKNEAISLITKSEQIKTVTPDSLHTVTEKLSGQLEAAKPDLIVELINALAPVDEYLQRHCVNVGFLNGLIGKWLGFPKETVDTLMLIGLLHDCGKAMAPRQILRAPRALSVVEYEVIKMHTDHGYSILDDFPETVRHGARSHHENYNGTGYPDGASGVAIPLLARITALSDIYDAMTARRCYKEPQSPFHVLSILKKMRSTILDPMLVDLFLENMPQELVDKPVMLSDGNIGIIHAIDPKNLEYPKVMTRGRIVKCDRDLYCKHMHFE